LASCGPANHHALFRVVRRVDQLLVLANLELLDSVAFLPLPTNLVASHFTGADSTTTAMLLREGTLTGYAGVVQPQLAHLRSP